MSKYNYNEKFFKIIDNEKKAYWLGFLYADGYITRFYRNDKLKSMSLELTLQESDKEHVAKFLNSLESNVPIQNKRVGKYKSSRVVINCTNMCRDLVNLGCTPKKSLTLTFPSIDILPDKYINHFIRGYFDGDGCVHYSEHICYNSQRGKHYRQSTFVCSIVGTNDFLNKIKDILFANGITSGKITQKEGQQSFELRIYGRDNLKKYYNYIYHDANIYMNRKNEKFKYAFKQLKIED